MGQWLATWPGTRSTQVRFLPPRRKPHTSAAETLASRWTSTRPCGLLGNVGALSRRRTGFDSRQGHNVPLVDAANDAGLSIRRTGFDSPMGHRFESAAEWSATGPENRGGGDEPQRFDSSTLVLLVLRPTATGCGQRYERRLWRFESSRGHDEDSNRRRAGEVTGRFAKPRPTTVARVRFAPSPRHGQVAKWEGAGLQPRYESVRFRPWPRRAQGVCGCMPDCQSEGPSSTLGARSISIRISYRCPSG